MAVHLTSTATLTPLKFMVAMPGAGFTVPKLSQKTINKNANKSTDEVMAEYKASVNNTTAPPGPKASWLGEIVVHGEDITRALGIPNVNNPEAVKKVADFYKGSNVLIGSKKRIADLKLRATDIDWSTGDGPEVAGPIASLVVAMTGRTAALEDLKGDGVDELKSRM